VESSEWWSVGWQEYEVLQWLRDTSLDLVPGLIATALVEICDDS
jgi:hypothetical protein